MTFKTALCFSLALPMTASMLAPMAIADAADETAKTAPKAPAITHTAIRDQVFLLQGDGGNIAVVNGERSLLVIDNGYGEQSAELATAINKIGDKPIRFLVNTHWHFDHAGANEHFGPRTNIVAHENVRKRLAAGAEMKAFNKVIPPVVGDGLPVVTYTDSTILHEADQRLRIQHFPNGHTDGDSAVFIEPSKIVHMGDQYFAGQLPFIDLESGGSVKGVSRNIEAVLGMIDDDWIVIPGHGPLSTKGDLAKTSAMLKQSISWMQQQIDKGLSMKDVSELGLPAELKAWATGFIDEPKWIGTVYSSMTATDG